MIIRSLDAAHDWNFGHGLTDFLTDENAINVNIQTRLLSWVGDCFFALQEGVDWRSRLDTGQQTALVDEVRSVILQSFGVVGINAVDAVFNPTTRGITITYDIQTIFSPSFEAELTQISGV